MNIMHYFLGLKPFHGGGLMQYAHDLACEQSLQGHDVSMLMPGNYKRKKSDILPYKSINNIKIYKINGTHPASCNGIKQPDLFFTKISNNNYIEFFKCKKIDILHIHTLMGLPIELLETVNKLGIKTVFTTHDYYAFCSKIYLFDEINGAVCIDNNNGINCIKCNASSLGEKHDVNIRNRNLNPFINIIYGMYRHCGALRVRSIKKTITNIAQGISHTNVLIKKSDAEPSPSLELASSYVQLRERNIEMLEKIDAIHFNSTIAREQYSKYIKLSKIKHYLIPVTHANIADRTNTINYEIIHDGLVHLLYMGYLDNKKGFFDLCTALENIYPDNKNWKLFVHGDCSNLDFKMFNPNRYYFGGTYHQSDLPHIFSNASLLVIPPKWKETFGFIGLEGLSYGIPVLSNTNAGFSDMIFDGENGMIYNEEPNIESLMHALVNILHNPHKLLNIRDNMLGSNNIPTISEHCSTIISMYVEMVG